MHIDNVYRSRRGVTRMLREKLSAIHGGEE
jgi:hypothetical protein